MISVDYPEPSFRRKTEQGREFLFDPLRKSWLQITPEEWVRQNFINYLLQVKHYPATLIAQEKKLQLGDLSKRFDILVYDSQHQPWLMVECKAATVRLDEQVLQQLLRYHIKIPCRYLVITNGLYTFGWEKMEGKLEGMGEMPEWGSRG